MTREPSSSFEFRPLELSDLPQLRDWLARPHVASVWGAAPTEAELREDYAPHADAPSSARAFIVRLEGKPVGFIQSYRAAEAGDGWWADERDPGVVGIDQFLADEFQLDKGIGTAMVRAFVDLLFRDPSTVRVQTDPHPENARAIRCYEKAGFRHVGEVDTPDGRALLMVCERPKSGERTSDGAGVT